LGFLPGAKSLREKIFGLPVRGFLMKKHTLTEKRAQANPTEGSGVESIGGIQGDYEFLPFTR
jgi:hypothetical protein